MGHVLGKLEEYPASIFKYFKVPLTSLNRYLNVRLVCMSYVIDTLSVSSCLQVFASANTSTEVNLEMEPICRYLRFFNVLIAVFVILNLLSVIHNRSRFFPILAKTLERGRDCPCVFRKQFSISMDFNFGQDSNDVVMSGTKDYITFLRRCGRIRWSKRWITPWR